MTEETTEATAVESDALAAVTAEWESAKQIHRRVGCWAYTSVRSRLMSLSRAGRIETKIEPGDGALCHRLFRKLR